MFQTDKPTVIKRDWLVHPPSASYFYSWKAQSSEEAFFVWIQANASQTIWTRISLGLLTMGHGSPCLEGPSGGLAGTRGLILTVLPSHPISPDLCSAFCALFSCSLPTMCFPVHTPSCYFLVLFALPTGVSVFFTLSLLGIPLSFDHSSLTTLISLASRSECPPPPV